MTRVKTVLTAFLALILGVFMTEGFLRLLIPVETQFETWFTPGIEVWDETFGPVYRSNWKGTMRHMDGIYRGIPLALDENGFRPAVRNSLPGEPKRVLLLGGRSAMMSYGLSDEASIAAQLVKAANLPMEAQSIARAGGNLLRNWNLFLHHMSDQEWDIVVISHLNPYLPAYADHSAFNEVPPPAPEDWAFRYMDGILLWRDGLFLEIGRPAFQSYLGYGLVRLADSTLKAFDRWGGPSSESPQDRIRDRGVAPDPSMLEDYRAFLEHVEHYFKQRDIPVLLHFVPRQFAEPDHHAPFREALETSFDVVDLHQRLHGHLGPDAFIANGHYGRELARLIGEELAREVSLRLAKRQSGIPATE
ncbi:MAG: hypothetical protein R6V45_09005 [Oceanipulchritudo sp.]